MVVNETNPLKRLYKPIELQRNQLEQKDSSGSTEAGKESFVDSLKGLIGDVNQSQQESAENTAKFVKGEPIDLHDVMISAEKAKTTFQLLMELRNKSLDTYRELIRIQV